METSKADCVCDAIGLEVFVLYSVLFQKAEEAEQIQNTQRKLACQNAPEVAGNACIRHGEEDKEQAYHKSQNIDDENMSCKPQTL